MMAAGLRLCWCLLFAFVIICSARNTISLSGDETMGMAMTIRGRSLMVKLDDYNEASANHGHDPRNRVGSGNGGGGGRKNSSP